MSVQRLTTALEQPRNAAAKPLADAAALPHRTILPMDSLTQIALGSAVSVAVMGRRTAVWKAALWGAACGTLPDLDALVDFGDPIRNMTMHRGDSHALFWLTLAAPPIAWLISRVNREAALFKRWWLAVWLVLVTHVLLDAMTVYGTQLLRPFSSEPLGVGSIFIIDPLYTLPLLVGLVAALRLRSPRGQAWNTAGLVLSSAYLVWGVAAQQYVQGVAQQSVRAQGIDARQILVTPTAFNSILWRVLVMTPDAYHEGYYSLFDRERVVHLDAFDRGWPLYEALREDWNVQRMAWFSRGYFRMAEEDGDVMLTDLRMGQEPSYIFTFRVAQRASAPVPIEPVQVGARIDARAGLAWLWRRMWGDPVPPPGRAGR